MRFLTWAMMILLAFGLASSSGCFGPPPDKPLTDEAKKKIDDDMRKAIDANKNAVDPKKEMKKEMTKEEKAVEKKG